MPPSFNDPDYPSQQGTLGPSGVNLTPLYDQYLGNGVRIGVVDTGIDYTQAELSGQVNVAAGWNALTHSPDALNQGGDQHGTWVAEILAARANNGIGGIGAAPGATLVGFKMETRDLRTAAQELELLQRQWQVDVSHNSWSYSGESFRDNFLGGYAAQGAAVAQAATQGRGGLGTVIVRSAGNNGGDGDSVNAHSYQNNRFTMTVGATDGDGNVQGFSNRGPAVWAVAPADATSFAAPLLSGAVALMLQANPGLGYRDVQRIVALTADFTDGAGPWKSNAAPGLANGGGFRTSTSAGFGMVDAFAAVRLAESWEGAPRTEANLLTASATGAAFVVPDVGTATGSVVLSTPVEVERALLTIDLAHAHVGDLRISLLSPSGTESLLLDRLGNGDFGGSGTLNVALTSNQFYGESGAGTWTLKVQDAVSGRVAQVNSWSLQLTGAPQTADDLYVFTDRYTGLASTEAGRRSLADTDGGTDTLNAAAVTTGSVIDLTPGATSTIAGTRLTIAAGTQIENAWGGDGADRILGSKLANALHGGRGTDRLTGGRGDDVLEGGPGNDVLRGGNGTDTAVFHGPLARFAVTVNEKGWVEVRDTAGLLGTDRLTGVERLAFDDANIAAPAAPLALQSVAWSAPQDGDGAVRGGMAPDFIMSGPGYQDIWGGPGPDSFAFRAGDGPDWLHDLSPGEDQIVVVGAAAAPLRTETLAIDGVIGTRLYYGAAAADRVFLEGLTEFDTTSVVLVPDLPGSTAFLGEDWPVPDAAPEEAGGPTPPPPPPVVEVPPPPPPPPVVEVPPPPPPPPVVEVPPPPPPTRPGGSTAGTPGDDILAGTPGADTITGGQGYDVMSGGAGADLFLLGLGDGGGAPRHDRILDFEPGFDRLGLPGEATRYVEEAPEGMWVHYGLSPGDNDWVLLVDVHDLPVGYLEGTSPIA